MLEMLQLLHRQHPLPSLISGFIHILHKEFLIFPRMVVVRWEQESQRLSISVDMCTDILQTPQVVSFDSSSRRHSNNKVLTHYTFRIHSTNFGTAEWVPVAPKLEFPNHKQTLFQTSSVDFCFGVSFQKVLELFFFLQKRCCFLIFHFIIILNFKKLQKYTQSSIIPFIQLPSSCYITMEQIIHNPSPEIDTGTLVSVTNF